MVFSRNELRQWCGNQGLQIAVDRQSPRTRKGRFHSATMHQQGRITSISTAHVLGLTQTRRPLCASRTLIDDDFPLNAAFSATQSK
jgi:hypothetical protein